MRWSFGMWLGLSLLWVVYSARSKQRTLYKIPGYEVIDRVTYKRLTESEEPSLVLFHAYDKVSSTPAFKFFAGLSNQMHKKMPSVSLHVFDCIREVEVCAELNIPKYPTAVLFANKNKYRFAGRHSWKSFAGWMKKLLVISSRQVRNMYEFKFFMKKFTKKERKPVIFFCGSSSHFSFKAFEVLSKNRKTEQYMFSESPEVMSKLNCTTGDTLFLEGGEDIRKNHHHSNKPYSLERFVLSNLYPNVSLLSLYHYRDFFDHSKPMLLVSDSHQDEEMLRLLDQVGTLFKNNVTVYYLYLHDHNQALFRKVEALLGTEHEIYPSVRYVKFENQKLRKFKMKGGISVEKIIRFLKRVNKGKIAPYLRSQPVKEHHKTFKVPFSKLETRRVKL